MTRSPAVSAAPAPGSVIAEAVAAIEAEEGAMTDKKRRVVVAAIEAFAELGYGRSGSSNT